MMKPHFKASDGCDYNPDIALMIWIVYMYMYMYVVEEVS